MDVESGKIPNGDEKEMGEEYRNRFWSFGSSPQIDIVTPSPKQTKKAFLIKVENELEDNPYKPMAQGESNHQIIDYGYDPLPQHSDNEGKETARPKSTSEESASTKHSFSRFNSSSHDTIQGLPDLREFHDQFLSDEAKLRRQSSTLSTGSVTRTPCLVKRMISLPKAGSHVFEVTNYGVSGELPHRMVSCDGERFKPASSFRLGSLSESSFIEMPSEENNNTCVVVTSADPSLTLQGAARSTRMDHNKNNIQLLAKIGKKFGERKKNRLVFKNGTINIVNRNVQRRGWRFILDIFTTILDLHWCYILAICALGFIIAWIIFALIWWAIAYAHGDSERMNEPGWQFCVIGVYNFHTAMLYSIETMHTIGYGTRAITTQCPVTLIILILESLCGAFITCVFTGLLFAKFSRPKQRGETILFSKSAVICENDGVRSLVFRVADMRKSYMIGVSVRAVLIQKHITEEGEVNPIHQDNLHLMSESEDFFFLAWPMKLVHIIDERSPLWTYTEEELIGQNFEIVVVLEGTNPTTGQSTQVCTSYLPAEVKWGHRLTPLVTERKKDGHYKIDYTKFHSTDVVEMSRVSAKEWSTTKSETKPMSKKLSNFVENK